MTFLPFLDGMVELMDIGYRSRAKFDPTKFRLIALNGTDAITQNSTLMELLKLELREADGYSRSSWMPAAAAAVKNLAANTVSFAPVVVSLPKPASPVVTQQWDCVALIADASPRANRAIASVASNAFQVTAHGLAVGDRVFFDGASVYPSGMSADTYYFVSATSFTANQFRIAATSGGAALTIGSSFSGVLTARCANGVPIGFEQVPIDGTGNNTRSLQPGQSISVAVQQGMG